MNAEFVIAFAWWAMAETIMTALGGVGVSIARNRQKVENTDTLHTRIHCFQIKEAFHRIFTGLIWAQKVWLFQFILKLEFTL